VPRTEVVFLDAETPVAEAAEIAASVPHSRLPVYSGTYDNVIGFVHVRDLLGPGIAKRSVPVSGISRPVKFLPISKTVLSSLSEMRRERAHLAIVVDDYGGTAGIVTLEDLVEELIGDIRDEYDLEQAPGDHAARRRGRGRRPAQPGRVRRTDRDRAARRPVRDRRGLRPGRVRRPALGRRQRAGRRPHDHGDRARRPPHRPPARHPGPPAPGARRTRRPPTPAPRSRRPRSARPAGSAGQLPRPGSQVRLDSETPRDGGPR
jgi:CBS domain-containing protein